MLVFIKIVVYYLAELIQQINIYCLHRIILLCLQSIFPYFHCLVIVSVELLFLRLLDVLCQFYI